MKFLNFLKRNTGGVILIFIAFCFAFAYTAQASDSPPPSENNSPVIVNPVLNEEGDVIVIKDEGGYKLIEWSKDKLKAIKLKYADLVAKENEGGVDEGNLEPTTEE